MIIMREGKNDAEAFQVAAAFDKHGIRIVAILPRSIGYLWTVVGQSSPMTQQIDFDKVDATIARIMNGEEQI